MTRWLRTLPPLLTLATAAACGAPKSTSGPKSVDAVVAADTPSATDEPDLSVVSAPKDLIFVARWRSAAASIDTLLAWLNLPIRRGSLFGLVPFPNAKDSLDSALALDTPVDLVVTLGAQQMAEPEPSMVVAAGLQSVEAGVKLAEQMGGDVVDMGRGVYSIDGWDDFDCVIAPATGPAAARLVCGEESSDVDSLLPYVTRGLTQETMGPADLHLEFRVEPIREAYGPLIQRSGELGIPFLLRELSFDDPSFDRALASAARGLATEVVALVDDLDKLTLDLELTSDSHRAELAFAAQFRGTKSWVARGVADAAKRSRVAPPEFWALPGSVPAASYSAPWDPDRGAPIRDACAELLDSVLAHGQLPQALRRDVRYLVDQTGTSSALRLGVQGPTPHKDNGKPDHGNAHGDELAEVFSKLDRQWGWQVQGYLGEPAAGFFKYFDTWVSVYNDPALKALLKKQGHGMGGKQLPTLRSNNVYRAGMAGAKEYEVTLPLRAWTDGTVADRTLAIVVMPDGKDTWVGSSFDEKLLLSEMAKLKTHGETLEGRTGLDALRGKEHFAGGFFTTRHVLEPILTGSLMAPSNVDSLFAGMPHRGETPIISTMDFSDQDGPRLVITATAPKDVIQDLATAIPALMENSILSGF